MQNEFLSTNFSGVFHFTNPTDEDFAALWNNKEYIYPAKKTSPMIIANETLENIQEIRKRFAYRLAAREFYKSKEYEKMSKMGNGLPPTFDEKILEPMIEQCLKPLPIAPATIKTKKLDTDKNFKGSKALGEKDNPNYIFRDESANPTALGEMSS